MVQQSFLFPYLLKSLKVWILCVLPQDQTPREDSYLSFRVSKRVWYCNINAIAMLPVSYSCSALHHTLPGE